eukprot:m.101316 g.101316  ORF g.101316 m.101316 type:complete len:68 (+) comp37125_c0_seq1:805-1008(+)
MCEIGGCVKLCSSPCSLPKRSFQGDSNECGFSFFCDDRRRLTHRWSTSPNGRARASTRHTLTYEALP